MIIYTYIYITTMVNYGNIFTMMIKHFQACAWRYGSLECFPSVPIWWSWYDMRSMFWMHVFSPLNGDPFYQLLFRIRISDLVCIYVYIYIWAFSWNWLVVNYAIPSSVRQTFDKDNIPPVLPAKFFADLWRNLVSFLIKCCFCFFWIIVYFQTHLSSSRGCFGSCAGARLPSKRLRNTLWKKTSSPTAQGALFVHVLWCAWTSGN